MSNKYTFKEWLAAWESDDFDNPDEDWLKWADKIVNHDLETLIRDGYHEGDCTNVAHRCSLCWLEEMLKLYREYYFNENTEDTA